MLMLFQTIRTRDFKGQSLLPEFLKRAQHDPAPSLSHLHQCVWIVMLEYLFEGRRMGVSPAYCCPTDLSKTGLNAVYLGLRCSF
jgi:hypothetical protein